MMFADQINDSVSFFFRPRVAVEMAKLSRQVQPERGRFRSLER